MKEGILRKKLKNSCTRPKRSIVHFLNDEKDMWDKTPHPRGPFRVDITGGVSARSQRRFNWPHFVQGRTWYHTHSEGAPFRIERFEVVWDDEKKQAVFFGTREDQEKFTVNPRAKSQDQELSWSTHGICEV